MTTETLMTEAATTTEGGATQDAPATTEATTTADQGVNTIAEATDSPKDGEATEATDKPAGAPEKYEFTLPEGFAKDGIISDLEIVAKEANLPQEQAQKFVDLGVKMQNEMIAKQQESIKTLNEGWIESAKTDKEFGGDKLNENLALAKKGLDAFGTPELKNLLQQTGLGNHPEIIRAFYKAGAKISDDTHVSANSGTPPNKDAAKVLYPNQA